MKRLLEVAAFSALSIFVHVVLFARVPDEGVDAGGAGGTATLTLRAADATVAEMVRTWDRPPAEVKMTVTDLPARAEQPAPAPELPAMDLVKAPQAAKRIAVPPPEMTPPIRDTDIPRPDVPVAPPDPIRPDPPPPDLQPPVTAARPRNQAQSPAADIETQPAPENAPEASLRPAVRPQATQSADISETARKSERNSPGRAAQRAAGSGGNSAAGQSNRTQAATASTGQQAKAQQVWGAKIRSRIERTKRYPRGTNASGQVSLVISIARGGQLLGVSVRQSSGNARLDEAALDAVRRAGRFSAAPEELPMKSYSFSIAVLLQR